ncbi:hypothetical protein BKA56DRAFT_604258 [Ilyonectria sp. MPI-CAGE-AT-0026]|nr:hypothetical protein BKA56DRAFT_604258 [Ilyonectria sp. MPI-CAGE-AT-0026]
MPWGRPSLVILLTVLQSQAPSVLTTTFGSPLLGSHLGRDDRMTIHCCFQPLMTGPWYSSAKNAILLRHVCFLLRWLMRNNVDACMYLMYCMLGRVDAFPNK